MLGGALLMSGSCWSLEFFEVQASLLESDGFFTICTTLLPAALMSYLQDPSSRPQSERAVSEALGVVQNSVMGQFPTVVIDVVVVPPSIFLYFFWGGAVCVPSEACLSFPIPFPHLLSLCVLEYFGCHVRVRIDLSTSSWL